MWTEMIRQWWRLMFWWLPHSDAGVDSVVSERVQPEPGSQPSSQAASPAAEAPESQSRDDLTRIKGIGEAMEKKLNDAGVVSFNDLASADADDLTATLKKSQPVLSANKVQGWIDEARQRAAH